MRQLTRKKWVVDAIVIPWNCVFCCLDAYLKSGQWTKMPRWWSLEVKTKLLFSNMPMSIPCHNHHIQSSSSPPPPPPPPSSSSSSSSHGHRHRHCHHNHRYLVFILTNLNFLVITIIIGISLWCLIDLIKWYPEYVPQVSWGCRTWPVRYPEPGEEAEEDATPGMLGPGEHFALGN